MTAIKLHNFYVSTSPLSLTIKSRILLTKGLPISLNFTLNNSSNIDKASKGFRTESLINCINSDNIFLRTKSFVFEFILGVDRDAIFFSSVYFIILCLLFLLFASSYSKSVPVFALCNYLDLGRI